MRRRIGGAVAILLVVSVRTVGAANDVQMIACTAGGNLVSNGTVVRLRPCQAVKDLHGCTYTLVGFQSTGTLFDRACFDVSFKEHTAALGYCNGFQDIPLGVKPPLDQHCHIPPKVLGVSIARKLVDLAIPQQPDGIVPQAGDIGREDGGPTPPPSATLPGVTGPISVTGPTGPAARNAVPPTSQVADKPLPAFEGRKGKPQDNIPWFSGLAQVASFTPFIPQDLDKDGIDDADDTCVCSVCTVPLPENSMVTGYFLDTAAGKAAKVGATWYRITGRERSGVAMDELLKSYKEEGPATSSNFTWAKAGGDEMDMTPQFGGRINHYPATDCATGEGACGEGKNLPPPGKDGFTCLCLDQDNDRVCSAAFGIYAYGNGGYPAVVDNCPFTKNLDQLDSNADGIGDTCEVKYQKSVSEGNEEIAYGYKPIDSDGDGVADHKDNCPNTPNAGQEVCDGYFGCACGDRDDDGVLDFKWSGGAVPVDNCPSIANPAQKDTDKDGRGDACDPCPKQALTEENDLDKDKVENACDNCTLTPNADQLDTDNDGIGNACDADMDDFDNDKIAKKNDNCPTVPNPGQLNGDQPTGAEVFPGFFQPDQHGDACDNCPLMVNNDQKDSDNDGIGDVCDPTPCGPVGGGGDVAANYCTCFTAPECQAWSNAYESFKLIKAKTGQ